MKTLTEEAINKISLETIKKTFAHTKKIEDDYWERDGLHISPEVPPIVINIANSSDDYSSYGPSSDNE